MSAKIKLNHFEATHVVRVLYGNTEDVVHQKVEIPFLKFTHLFCCCREFNAKNRVRIYGSMLYPRENDVALGVIHKGRPCFQYREPCSHYRDPVFITGILQRVGNRRVVGVTKS